MKKNISLLFITTILVSALTLSSCEKYEEGPAISFRSAVSRVVGVWKYSNVTLNNKDITSTFNSKVTIEFKEDSNYTYTDPAAGTPDKGRWYFEDDKASIRVKSLNDRKYTIIRLKKDDMWLKLVDGPDTYLYKFAPNK